MYLVASTIIEALFTCQIFYKKKLNETKLRKWLMNMHHIIRSVWSQITALEFVTDRSCCNLCFIASFLRCPESMPSSNFPPIDFGCLLPWVSRFLIPISIWSLWILLYRMGGCNYNICDLLFVSLTTNCVSPTTNYAIFKRNYENDLTICYFWNKQMYANC